MSQQKIKDLIGKLQNICRDAVNTAKTASRNRISLSGHNFYGDKFHGHLVEISSLETQIQTNVVNFLSETETTKLSSIFVFNKINYFDKKTKTRFPQRLKFILSISNYS